MTAYISHQLNISDISNTGTLSPRTSFNQFDDHGYMVSLSRLRGESNWEYKRRILDAFVHIANSSYQGLVYGITRELGLSLFQPFAINPKVDSVTGEFLASDPYIKFDGAYIYLYSDYANDLLDYKIDRYAAGGNYEHLGRLAEMINTTVFFEANVIEGFDEYTRSMTILNQSNRNLVSYESLPASTKIMTKYDRIVNGSIYFNDYEIFAREVASESDIVRRGDYYINYHKGIITTHTAPEKSTTIRYNYTKYPFIPMASSVILHDINNDNFKTKMFEQVLQDDGTYVNGLPTEIGTDIINELLSVVPMYWGI